MDWIKRFILFHGKRHPTAMGKPEVKVFLTHLAVVRNVAASTQNQALSAILFLYKEVLGRELEWLDNVERAKRPARRPVVLTEAEVWALLVQMEDRQAHGADPLRRRARAHGVRAPEDQGCGLRLFADHRPGWQGPKRPDHDLPASLHASLLTHLERIQATHQKDLEDGFGEVYLPFALARYPRASRDWG